MSFRAQWRVPIGRGLRGGIPLYMSPRSEGDSFPWWAGVPSGPRFANGMTNLN
jgi:hypothetical protein